MGKGGGGGEEEVGGSGGGRGAKSQSPDPKGFLLANSNMHLWTESLILKEINIWGNFVWLRLGY